MKTIITAARLAGGLALAAVCTIVAPAQTYDYTITAAVSSVTVQPGTTLNTWTYNNSLPAPVIRATEGQHLRIRFVNHLPEPSIIHWHGLEIPLGHDGIIGVSRPAVAPGEEFIYEFDAPASGTYWYHPHVEDQLDLGMYGMMIIDPANPTDDPPFDQEAVIILDDSINLNLNPPKAGIGIFAGHLLNGKTSAGQSAINVQGGQTLRVRILNASARTSYAVALDGHPLTLTHADGHRVQPVTVGAVPIGPGERWDALVNLNNPGVWSLAASLLTSRSSTVVRTAIRYAGQTGAMPAAAYVPPNLATGSILDYAQLASFHPVTPITATPQRTYPLALGMAFMGSTMMFTINGEAFPMVTPMPMTAGEIVQFDLVNTMTPGMGSQYHPMHVHGHSWRLLGTAGGTTNPPIKDTVLMRLANQPGSTLSVQLTANNPGRWLIHCHDALHMMMGMMALIDYTGDADGDGLPDNGDMDPLSAYPVLTIPGDGSAFQVGHSGAVSVQWAPGENVDFFLGVNELAAPMNLGNWGVLNLWPVYYLASVTTTAAADASLPYSIPNDPNLSGVRFGIQAGATTALAPGYRISTWQPLTVR